MVRSFLEIFAKPNTQTLNIMMKKYKTKFVPAVTGMTSYIQLLFVSLRILTRKHHPKKTPALTKNTNMDIWVVGTSN